MHDVICERDADGTPLCLLPHQHQHHSPTGFEFGHDGSGAADLALNVLAAALPLEDGAEGVTLRDGSRVSEAAWELHQPFQSEVIATMPPEGGAIAGAVIEAWIVAHQHARQDAPGPT